MSGFPLRLGSEAAFRTVREFLAGSGYNEEFCCGIFRCRAFICCWCPSGCTGRIWG